MPVKPPARTPRCGCQHPPSTEHHWCPPLRSSCTTQEWEKYTGGQESGHVLPSSCGWEFEHPGIALRQAEPCLQLHCLYCFCPGKLGRSNTGTHKTSGKISAINILGSGSAKQKEIGQPRPKDRPSAFSKGRSALAFTSHETVLLKSELQLSHTYIKDAIKIAPAKCTPV